MRFGSLFAGIGGLDLGLERAGMQSAWQVEIDDYATRVLAKHWPDVPRFRDVREVGAHNLPSVDLICGGFPCQDISYAGKGAGLAGERSGLWYEYARVVRELRPRYVLVENVAALLTRGLDAVLGTLAELGYDAEWECISAASVGAPHLRKRIFIVAHSRCERGESRGEARNMAGTGGGVEGEAQERQWGWDATHDSCTDVADAATVPDTNSARLERQRPNSDSEGREEPIMGPIGLRDRASQWDIEPDVGRVAARVPARMDRLRGLGNAVVPQCAEYIGRLIVQHAAQPERAG